MCHIKRLSINGFRGVPKEIEVDFTDNGKPISLLVLGDNGTGKTSIADSLEFCLRGKISRRGNAGLKARREAQNYFTLGPPSVAIELSNGSKYFRGAAQHPFGGKPVQRLDPVPGFGLAPITINRADIEIFWQVEPNERMRFFFDYLRDPRNQSGYAALDVERFEQQLVEARLPLLEAQIELARITQTPVEQVPVDSQASFYRWRRDNYKWYRSKRDVSGTIAIILPQRISKNRQMVADAILTLERQVSKIHQINSHLLAKRAEAKSEENPFAVISADIPELLREVGSQATAEFGRIAKLEQVSGIEITPGGGYALDIKCILSNDRKVDPTQILSEGNLDLLAFLIMLAVTRSCASRGQSTFLVLDDVWQSVDAIHRNSILEYLFSPAFKSWQFVITVHDRLWARLIENKARKLKKQLQTAELTSWSLTEGPRIRYRKLDTLSQLRRVLDDAPPDVLCPYVGRALEELADELSISMRTSVRRTPGDRYTLEDLWPKVRETLASCKASDTLPTVTQKVDANYILRNMYGAHYNEWAQSVSQAEAREFAELVVELWDETHCGECSKPLTLVSNSNKSDIDWSCNHHTRAQS
jgi:recombinational DNA repair ATPase RecF